ncbi:uncharacterized protein [Euwallacea similis]|uniref:uncharacterized protein isoform X1 n=1 Tax=Euwallacea similis TaxID=1736056 RepID=UPI00344B4A26
MCWKKSTCGVVLVVVLVALIRKSSESFVTYKRFLSNDRRPVKGEIHTFKANILRTRYNCARGQVPLMGDCRDSFGAIQGRWRLEGLETRQYQVHSSAYFKISNSVFKL